VLLNGMAALCFSSQQAAQGVKKIEMAQKRDPALSASYLNLASYYASSGEFAKAIEQYKALLKIDARNARALLGLAALYQISGREGEALAQYRRGAQERIPEAFLAQASLYQKTGETDRAVQALDQAIKLDPGAAAPLEMKGRLLVAAKKYREALQLFEQMKAVSHDAAATLRIGTYLAMQDRLRAAQQARRLIASRPGSAAGHLALASVYESQQDLAGAVSELSDAIRVDPGNVEARVRLGNLFEARQEFDRAMATYQDALRVRPCAPAPLFAQGALLERTGRKKEAVGKYRALLESREGFVPALNNLACLCADGYGDEQEALRLAVSAFMREPWNAAIMDTVGYALFKNGRSDQAVQVLERAVQRLPRDPSVRYHLALAYSQSGDKPGAEQSLKKSLELGEGPDAAAARALLAQLKR